MKILIAGFGSIGRRHFRNLKSLGVEEFVFLRSHYSTLPDDEIASYPVETDVRAALAHRPAAVIVANPTALHLDVAIPAAEAGCHLFLEKPISHSWERLDILETAVARTSVKVLVGFQFRFHPGLRLIKELLVGQPPTIGRPVSFCAHWGEYLPNWHPWENYRQGYAARADLGGGVILTLSHPLDYARWLFGEGETAWALTSRRGLGLEVDDTAEIGLRFASGVIGSVHLNYLQRPPSHHLEIVGTEGTIRWDNADGVVRVYSASSPHPSPLPKGEGDGLPSTLGGEVGGEGEWHNFPPPPGFERNVMFLDQMRHFLAVCRGAAEPVCTLRDGIQALRLALGAGVLTQTSE
jgi:predicted dehydrogenase